MLLSFFLSFAELKPIVNNSVYECGSAHFIQRLMESGELIFAENVLKVPSGTNDIHKE